MQCMTLIALDGPVRGKMAITFSSHGNSHTRVLLLSSLYGADTGQQLQQQQYTLMKHDKRTRETHNIK